MPQLLLKGKPIGEIEGVLFDKDGTLSDSEDHLIKLANRRIQEAIAKFPLKNVSDLGNFKGMLARAYGLAESGLQPDGTLAIASRQSNLISTATVFCLFGESWPSSIALANEVFSAADSLNPQDDFNFNKIRLLPGALNLLKRLQSAGIICALISNDTSENIHHFLLGNNLETIIPYFWSADHSPAKPDPMAVEGLCNKIGLTPRKCALIGDAETDLKMAKEAQVSLPLGYISGWSSPPVLTAHSHLITHWDELAIQTNPKVIDSLGSP